MLVRIFALAAVLLCLVARADTIVLNDGTTLNGAVMKSGDRYWVQTDDGKTRFIDASDVKQIISSHTPDSVAAAPANATFYVVKARAQAVTTPSAAVDQWQKYIDSKPAADDLAKAKDELAKWKALADGHAEKINGAWVGGDDLKRIIDQCDALAKEGAELMNQQKTLAAVAKFQDAVKVYPNSYPINSYLGYISMLSHNDDDAMNYFTRCMKLEPDAPDALNNMAVVYWDKKEYDLAMVKFDAAAEAGDDISLAMNINKAVHLLPASELAGQKKLVQAADLLAAKYRFPPLIDWAQVHWHIMMPRAAAGGTIMPGMSVSGTGFLVSGDGLILTNRHVVEGAKSYEVLMDGGVKLPAELVDIDTVQDLALLRIKGDKKFPTVHFSNVSAPPEGALCYAIGFPLIDRLGASIKITQGIVSGGAKPTDPVDVLIDAKVNPGNSGGPLLGKYGDVIGIVTMKSLTSTTVDSYGMAISVGHIRTFLTKEHVAVPTSDAIKVLSAEDIVAAVRGATVCIVAAH